MIKLYCVIEDTCHKLGWFTLPCSTLNISCSIRLIYNEYTNILTLYNKKKPIKTDNVTVPQRYTSLPETRCVSLRCM